ncbi:hypothetical protein PICMEDRAFT_97264 [Pichia membranifaciens NRRL Y-2026]|uniref:Uncharacterized protein n=1 Tax=Pichia membranifaciens NRRL Y-2026 TaxID=763406 RepID=A0A1E3NU53_9ASCO|nr:hypothetical protein PICMEDRAFT_97264 [Pichia membranifaciens NRRL Y-2026]ODQ49208.1 hypothetical protein PICMEDRAFT_97264 [Pichia membranifaciens NRRL Y-2026]
MRVRKRSVLPSGERNACKDVEERSVCPGRLVQQVLTCVGDSSGGVGQQCRRLASGAGRLSMAPRGAPLLLHRPGRLCGALHLLRLGEGERKKMPGPARKNKKEKKRENRTHCRHSLPPSRGQ